MNSQRRSKRAGSIALVAVLAAAVLAACASIVGVEEPSLVPSNNAGDGSGVVSGDGGEAGPSNEDGGGSGPQCSGEGCACGNDDDCVDPRHKACVQNKCAECKADPDNCDDGSYCLTSTTTEVGVQNRCVPGCKNGAECMVLSPSTKLCNTTLHQCVECIGDGDCAGSGGGNKKCSPSGVCADTCISDGGAAGACPNGQTCCTNLCVDLTKDVFNCKTCGAACPSVAGARCCDSACKATLTDPTSCGACGTTCTATNVKNANNVTCAAGQCTYATCKTGFADCNNDKKDGCECTCPSKCASCTTGAGGIAVCNVNCNDATPCRNFTCPAGMACHARCTGTHVCENGFACAAGFPCTLECSGTQACNGMQIDTSQSALCIECNGSQACNGLLCTEGSLACKQHCGASACANACGNCSSVGSCL